MYEDDFLEEQYEDRFIADTDNDDGPTEKEIEDMAWEAFNDPIDGYLAYVQNQEMKELTHEATDF